MKNATFTVGLSLAALISLPSCSSHLISAGLDDGQCAGGNCSTQQTSIGGRAGLNSHSTSGKVVSDKCGARPMTRVEVRRDLGQGLVSALTLGVVNPATIIFACAKPPSRDFLNCSTIDGTQSEDSPVQIMCTKPNSGNSETIRYDCTSTGTADQPGRLAAFSCNEVSARFDHVWQAPFAAATKTRA